MYLDGIRAIREIFGFENQEIAREEIKKDWIG